ncbi:hypothetical protein GGI04_000445 [Coemansia thaxteri]|uniref:Uncharacterized protein n=1 Tax=Coemansia thaxteri TaxID=2663907 RepID=A0A9W8BM84_9FUNG|nr:hypothetical protein H4R26_001441 [Coemansia thaxteri]KAJ2009473.1 hypothetical protein GGI04_000445 [Coemansia thaxteri]KAJ2473298.1 hypothetical protein GGI02_000968 [Coemansia sp. RSA 2322]KAJ2484060.1 hypothetical protein EV174_002737 [Coemansia sp. RSA 2320]
MGEYVKDVRLMFCISEDDTFSAAEFPFELIGSYVAVQDIPHYSFALERQVRQEMAEFKDDLAMRNMHQEYQRRPARRATGSAKPQQESAQPMLRAQSTPLNTVSSNGDLGVRVKLPLQRKPEEAASRPMTSRIKSLFRSKTRTTPHA